MKRLLALAAVLLATFGIGAPRAQAAPFADGFLAKAHAGIETGRVVAKSYFPLRTKLEALGVIVAGVLDPRHRLGEPVNAKGKAIIFHSYRPAKVWTRASRVVTASYEGFDLKVEHEAVSPRASARDTDGLGESAPSLVVQPGSYSKRYESTGKTVFVRSSTVTATGLRHRSEMVDASGNRTELGRPEQAQ